VLQASGNTLQKVENFKYISVVFESDGRQNKEVYTGVGTANALPCKLYHSVFTKQEIPNIAKLSFFKSVFVPILTYGHGSWVMTERILSQEQGQRWVFAKSSQCDTLRHSAQL